MNYDAVLNIIKAARLGKHDENFAHMLGNFQELVELMNDYQKQVKNNQVTNKEWVEAVKDRLLTTFNELKEEYSQFCEKREGSPEKMMEYFNNPRNFSPQIWEQLQNFNRRFGVGEKVSFDSKCKSSFRNKKFKKSKLKPLV